MKSNLLFALAFIGTALQGFAQTNVTLNIHHKLNGAALVFGETGTSNLDEEFEISRLEYYLSGFTITYDGGQTLVLDDLYALVDASEPTAIDLGALNATTIEGIGFHVGVDEANNHGDPAQWESDHPLAPQFPSMHWGWTPGYRFVAFEGYEISTDQLFQLHGLGDINYFENTFEVEIPVDGAETSIDIDAQCEELLRDVSIHNGLIVHSELQQAKTVLENMRDHVFAPAAGTTALPELGTDFTVRAFPNPTSNARVSFTVESSGARNFQIQLTDIVGKVVYRDDVKGNGTPKTLELPKAGMYLLRLSVDGVPVHVERLISR